MSERAQCLSGDRPIRLVVIVGSPRTRGNSALVAEIIRVEAARWAADHEVNVDVSVVSVATTTVSGCTACGACANTGACTINDFGQDTVKLIEEGSALAWITPVYFGSVPAQLKAVIDRFQVFWERRRTRRRLGQPSPYHARRPGMAVLLRGGGDPFGYDAAMVPLRSASNLAEVTLGDPVVVEGVHGSRDVASEQFTQDRSLVSQRVGELLDAALLWERGEVQ